MYFREMPGTLWRLIREERRSKYFWTLMWVEFKHPFRVNWQNRWRWRLLGLIPDRVKYWVIVETACKGEKGHPGYVTVLTMMERLDPMKSI